MEHEGAKVAREIRSGCQIIDVEVAREKNWDRGIEEVIRTDTGEVVETRPLTPTERQMRLKDIGEEVKGKTKSKSKVTSIKRN